jgi:TolB-like protein
MKRSIVLVFALVLGIAATFGQSRPVTVIAPFTGVGGVSAADAESITELFTSQIASLNKITVVDRRNQDAVVREMKFQVSDWADDGRAAQMGRALKAAYLIRGQVMKLGDQFFLSMTTLDIEKLEIVASTNQQFSSMGTIMNVLPKAAGTLAEGLAPAPKGPSSPLVGVWTSTGGSDLQCTLEFTDDGKLYVRRYDIPWGTRWEWSTKVQLKKTLTGRGGYEYQKSGRFTVTMELEELGAAAFEGRMSGGNGFQAKGTPEGPMMRESNLVSSIDGLYTSFTRQF